MRNVAVISTVGRRVRPGRDCLGREDVDGAAVRAAPDREALAAARLRSDPDRRAEFQIRRLQGVGGHRLGNVATPKRKIIFTAIPYSAPCAEGERGELEAARRQGLLGATRQHADGLALYHQPQTGQQVGLWLPRPRSACPSSPPSDSAQSSLPPSESSRQDWTGGGEANESSAQSIDVQAPVPTACQAGATSDAAPPPFALK